jgi:hypothetical protein
MLISIIELRRLIREEIRDAMSPAKNDREPIGSLGKRTLDPEAQEEDELPSHLRDTDFDPEDYWGPVPPAGEEPYATLDPYEKDTGILPSPHIYRGRRISYTLTGPLNAFLEHSMLVRATTSVYVM